MKKINLLLSMVIFLGLLSESYGQVCNGLLPTTVDRVARPTIITNPGCNFSTSINTTSNTGFEIFKDASGVNCRVMVWDGTRASFAWDYGSGPGGPNVNNIEFGNISQLNGGTLTDPDIVVQDVSGTTFAMFVGIVTGASTNNDKVFWASYGWSTSSNQFVYHTSGFLGDNSGGAKCFNPNIDVNACGMVSVTWHRERTEIVNITTTNSSSGTYNLGPDTVSFLRADVYGAYGRIDASNCALAGKNVASGDLISDITTLNHLFEKNTTPDVCISDNTVGSCATGGAGDYFITYTWQQSWFNPLSFSNENAVIVKQYEYNFNSNGCIIGTGGGAVSGYPLQLNFFNHLERPRIAARPTEGTTVTHYSDFQIVLAYFNIGCTTDNSSCPATCSISHSSGVLNWGRHNSNNFSTLDAVNLTIPTRSPCDLSRYYNNNAVVSYLNKGFGTSGNYAVAWEHGPDPVTCDTGITNTASIDIVSRTYNNGNSIGASPDYSIVNNNFCNSTQAGKQLIPSIGGRHANQQMGFDFWDQQLGSSRFFIAYKATAGSVKPGTGSLRTVGPDPGTEEEIIKDHDPSFNASPNPFTNEVTFSFDLNKDEKPIAIEIFDTKGFIVGKIDLIEKPSARTIKLNYSSGVYLAKLKTDTGELVTRLVKTK